MRGAMQEDIPAPTNLPGHAMAPQQQHALPLSGFGFGHGQAAQSRATGMVAGNFNMAAMLKAKAEQQKAGAGREALVSKQRKPPLNTVLELFEEASQLVYHLVMVWSLFRATTSSMRLKLPGRVDVRCGPDDITPVPLFLLADLQGIDLAEITGKSHSRSFLQVITALKLRWLLRLHGAGCFLDAGTCSFARLLLGLLRVSVSHSADTGSDSIFSSKRSEAATNLNLEALLDNMLEDVQKGMGASWGEFSDFVMAQNSQKAFRHPQLNIQVVEQALADGIGRATQVATEPQGATTSFTGAGGIGSDDSLQRTSGSQSKRSPGPATSGQKTTGSVVSLAKLVTTLDDVLLAHLLKQPLSCRLSDVLDEMAKLGIRKPVVDEEGQVPNLLVWMKSRSPVTRKSLQKAAQRAALHIVAGLELRLQIPPAPLESLWVDVACAIISHQYSFPEKFRKRLVHTLSRYSLTPTQTKQVDDAGNSNMDEPRLSDATLTDIHRKELARLRWLRVSVSADTDPFLLPALAGPPALEHQTPLYLREPQQVQEMRRSASVPSGLMASNRHGPGGQSGQGLGQSQSGHIQGNGTLAGSQSMMSLHGTGRSPGLGRMTHKPAWKVSMVPGPLVWDQQVGDFSQASGLFKRMGIL